MGPFGLVSSGTDPMSGALYRPSTLHAGHHALVCKSTAFSYSQLFSCLNCIKRTCIWFSLEIDKNENVKFLILLSINKDNSALSIDKHLLHVKKNVKHMKKRTHLLHIKQFS